MSLSSSMYIGVSGMNSFSTALQVVSDNVANAHTTGYKSNSATFGDMVTNALVSSHSQNNDKQGIGSRVMGVDTNHSIGPLIGTSQWSDVALEGKGFFMVSDSNVAGGEVYYTRDGNFHTDKDGWLVNGQGMYVLDQAGNGFQVDDPTDPAYPNYHSFEIDEEGRIWGIDDTGASVEVQPGSQLGVALFTNEQGLIREGGNLFSEGSESGNPFVGTPGEDGRGTSRNMMLENSNVDLAKQMTDMIVFQADYNANSKTISTSSRLVETVVSMVR